MERSGEDKVGLNFGGMHNLFEASPEDGQYMAWAGFRRVPTDLSARTVELYVAADGTGDFLTIAEAVTALDGDAGTIRVKAGTYTITSAVTLVADQTIIGGGYSTNIQTTSDITMINLNGNNSGIFMCRIDGNDTGSSQIGIEVDGDYCTIKDCWVQDMGDFGIQINSGADYCVVEGCRIIDCDDDCMEIAGNYVMVSDCVIDDGSQDGIYITGNFGSLVGNKIMNHGEHGISLVGATQTTIVGNYIFSNGDNNNDGDGIEVGISFDVCITGNIIHTNDGYGVDITSGVSQKTLIMGNSILNNEDGAINDSGTATLYQTATDSDPLNAV